MRGWVRRRWIDVVVVIIWVAVSFLPWWQIRYGVSIPSGSRLDPRGGSWTETSTADVWRASSTASWAVLLAVLAVVPSRALDRAVAAPRRVVSAVLAWVSVALMIWTGWSLAPAGELGFVAEDRLVPLDSLGQPLLPEFGTIVRDHLTLLSLPGFHEGLALGAYVGAALILFEACLLTAWIARPITIPGSFSERHTRPAPTM